MHTPDNQKLAEKIANMLQNDSQSSELAALFASVEKINHRLDKLEISRVNFRSDISDLKEGHASLDKFSVAEAIADGVFDHLHKEKACQFEPGKPCDHCSMCNSRGF